MQANLSVEAGPGVGNSYTVRPGAPFLIGAAAGVQMRVEGAAARHVAIVLDPTGLKVVDLAGGVTLDGAPLALRQPMPVGSGQAIEVAGARLRVELDGAPEPQRGAAAARTQRAIEGYDVLAVLGQGGMGTVLHARRQADGLEVAVKVLNEEVVPGSPDHRRFLVEGQVGLRLRHPHIVPVLDLRVDAQGRALIVMELVRGPSLQALLARQGALPVAHALRGIEQVAHGLGAAHAAGVIHRDVKPANVLLGPDGAARLTDFGVAKDLEGTVRSLTKSGVGLGTIGYMSPEQLASARDVGPATDVYGLGATLFHALSGRPPLVCRSPEDLPRLLEEPHPALTSLRPDCPPPVEALVHAMLAREPWDRPQSARDVIAALRAL